MSLWLQSSYKSSDMYLGEDEIPKICQDLSQHQANNDARNVLGVHFRTRFLCRSSVKLILSCDWRLRWDYLCWNIKNLLIVESGFGHFYSVEIPEDQVSCMLSFRTFSRQTHANRVFPTNSGGARNVMLQRKWLGFIANVMLLKDVFA